MNGLFCFFFQIDSRLVRIRIIFRSVSLSDLAKLFILISDRYIDYNHAIKVSKLSHSPWRHLHQSNCTVNACCSKKLDTAFSFSHCYFFFSGFCFPAFLSCQFLIGPHVKMRITPLTINPAFPNSNFNPFLHHHLNKVSSHLIIISL